MDNIGISIAILLIFFVISRAFNVFDFRGSIAALVVGFVVSVFGSYRWLILLLIFATGSFIVTRAYFNRKSKINAQEGKKGERGIYNVVYAGIIGLFVAFLNGTTFLANLGYFHYFTLFAVSLAVVNSDTFASEIGVLDNKVRMITNLKRTVPGINGGVSLLGEMAALCGALIIGISYGILSTHGFVISQVLIITAFGFLGCQIDSILGAVFENKGKLSKGMVNFLSAFIIVIMMVPIIFFFGI